MNKTININLGGFFFHIDETAYQKLKRYLDAIARSLNDDPQGKNEIIADIEARISELLSEKITDARQVVNEQDIDSIIAIMGQPEDYAEAEEGYTQSTSTDYQQKRSATKKLFRDGEDKFLGGVCSGLGHYLGIDTIWIRLAFIVLVASGFSPLAYILLWILLPEAKTTAEKLQMEGEPVNIDNIEKKIRNEFENISMKLKDGANEISEKISKADYEKLRNQTKSGLQDFLETIGKILAVLFKVFGKFIGAFLIFLAGVTLFSLIIGLFSVGSIEFLDFDESFIKYPNFFYESMLPKWLLTTLLFLLIGIPFVALFILGLRILSTNVKPISKGTSLILSGIWLISLFGVVFTAIEFGSSKAFDGVKAYKQNIAINQNDTLRIRVVNDDSIFYSHSLRRRNNAEEVTINDAQRKYSNWVKIDVKKSDTNTAFVEIKQLSEGRNRKMATNNAEEIDYRFNMEDTNIVFDAYFLSDIKNIRKDEGVKATIYIPNGTVVYFEESSRNFLSDVNNTENIYDKDMANHHFTMTTNGFECTDCKDDTNDWNTEENENTI